MNFITKYYISDMHLMHDRILEMQPRAFSSIDDHDEHIIKCWNNVVKKDEDRVYVLGDFAMKLSDKSEKLRYYFSRLKGRKHLIVGNHDLDEHGNIHPTLLSLDWAERPEWMKITKDGGHKLTLCHYGIREWQGKHSGAYHFYGHAHGRLPALDRSRDVGCDMPDVNFTPKTFSQLTKKMK